MKFWDSSAVVPLLVDESAATEAMHKVLGADPSMVVWVLTPTEVTGALWRRHRTGDLANQGLTAAQDGLSELEQAWSLVIEVDQVQRRARRLLAVHPLRSADALQLAASLVATDEKPHLLPFVTLDERLADAARREGFRVLP
jgi:predicted nucleic acid-binding protein